MSKKEGQSAPRGLTLLEALTKPVTPAEIPKDTSRLDTAQKPVVKPNSKTPGASETPAKTKENSARAIIADPETEKSVFNALRIGEKEFSKLVAIAKEICAKTAPIEAEINKTLSPAEKENDLPFFGTGAIVLFNVIHAVGILAERLSYFREDLLELDRSSRTKGEHIAREFDKKFAVYLAHRMNLDINMLSKLPENELRINFF